MSHWGLTPNVGSGRNKVAEVWKRAGEKRLLAYPRDLFLYKDDCHYKEQSGDNQADQVSAKLREQQHPTCHITY